MGEKELEGKVVLVTGGGRGIGAAIASAFASQGSDVAVAGRTLEQLERVAGEIRSLGRRALAVRCDVTRGEEVEALRDRVAAELGPVQILVNNAGLAPAAAFLEMQSQLWEEVLRVNLTGTYLCCRAFLPGMLDRGWGRIINIASTMAKTAYSHVTAYAASKHGVLGLTRGLAAEVARRGITVNAICPGYVDTETTRANAKKMAEKTGKKVEEVLDLFKRTSPQNRLIAPEEVAQVALMLASVPGINGQAVGVDGGAVMA